MDSKKNDHVKNEMVKNNSTSIDLENLQKQYSNVLTQYRQSVSDYMNHINQNNDNKSFVHIKGQAYLGTQTLQQINNTDINRCEALCANDKKCSGATFKSNVCIIKTGDSQIIQSSNDSYAIIPEGKKLLMNMEKLNEELININKKISDKLNGLQPEFKEANNERKTNTNELLKNYKELMDEREEIIKLLNEYKTLDNTQDEYEVKITQNYYLYLLYILISIFMLYLLYKFSFSTITISAPQTNAFSTVTPI
jgi:hypothetical protein